MNLAVMNLLSIVCMPAVLASEGASQEEIEQEQRRSRDRFEAHMTDSLNGAIEWGDGQDEGDRPEDEQDVFGVMEDDD